jgi:rhodanese-related sulfurtransferase
MAVPDISVEDLNQQLQGATPPVIIDVREPVEYEICHLPNATLIPLGTLPERFTEIPRDVPVVVQCHHGGRSARAVAFLQQQGYTNAVNLAGGIHAWALRIDPSVRTY